MSTIRISILSALLLALTGCVAYDPYYADYPAYGAPVYVPPPVAVYPSFSFGYSNSWHGHGYGHGHGHGWGHGGGRGGGWGHGGRGR